MAKSQSGLSLPKIYHRRLIRRASPCGTSVCLPWPAGGGRTRPIPSRTARIDSEHARLVNAKTGVTGGRYMLQASRHSNVWVLRLRAVIRQTPSRCPEWQCKKEGRFYEYMHRRQRNTKPRYTKETPANHTDSRPERRGPDPGTLRRPTVTRRRPFLPQAHLSTSGHGPCEPLAGGHTHVWGTAGTAR